MPTFDAVKDEYARLWKSMKIREGEIATLDSVCKKMLANKKRYSAVAEQTGVPWPFIAITHNRESGMNFSRHLHNGDPLTGRTVQVPRGRPKTGKPPFTWEESAIDALLYHALDKVDEWTVERLAFEFERYNGFGYRNRKLPSPYLWASSQHYVKGKYIADGVFSPTAVDKQLGCMPMLKRLADLDEGVARSLDGSTAPFPPPPDIPKPEPAPQSWIAALFAAVLAFFKRG